MLPVCEVCFHDEFRRITQMWCASEENDADDRSGYIRQTFEVSNIDG